MIPGWLTRMVHNARPGRRLRPHGRRRAGLHVEPLEGRELLAAALEPPPWTTTVVGTNVTLTIIGGLPFTPPAALDGPGLQRLLDDIRRHGWLVRRETWLAPAPQPPAVAPPVVAPSVPPSDPPPDTGPPTPPPASPPPVTGERVVITLVPRPPDATRPPASPEPRPAEPEPPRPAPNPPARRPDASPALAPTALAPPNGGRVDAPPVHGPVPTSDAPAPAPARPPVVVAPPEPPPAPRPPAADDLPSSRPASAVTATPIPSDGALLRRFAVAREEGAFAELVRRHGRAVLAVCTRVVGDPDQARDASQSAFLALARRAGALDAGGSLAGWLHTVARRFAVRLRAAAARRQRLERAAARQPSPPPDAPAGDDELRAVREELARLPDKYRVPLTLCYLDGRTHAEVARAVGLPRGSVAKRIGEGLDRLRERLAARGLA